MNDLISIILPVYNGEKFLTQSIESILQQTYKNWELIIVDDCSTDSTPNISQKFASEDTRIKYYRNDTNLKLPRNLNRGFSLSNGDYLTWTSDDNVYLPTALEKMLTEIKNNPGVDFAFASCRIIDEHNNEVEYIMVSEQSIKKIVGQNEIGACFLYSRKVYETIGDYDHNCILVEDFDYWQRVLHKFKAIYISDILYKYRYHSGALTSTMKQEIFCKNLEKVILKNLNGFGKLSLLQKYYLYNGLNFCRTKCNTESNPYKIKFKFYSIYYLFFYRIPKKIQRMLG